MQKEEHKQPQQGPEPLTEDQRHQVTMSDSHTFEPSRIHLRSGETVRWINQSTMNHTVTLDRSKVQDPTKVMHPEKSERFDSGILQPGEEFEKVFTVPGQYQYVCLIHENENMVGEIIVETDEPNTSEAFH